MKVLIIGGTGIISTSITRFLIERGDDICLYNRGMSKQIGFPEKVKNIIGDRKDYKEFEKQMLEAGYFDCVIDMVAYMPDDVESAIRAFKGRIGQYIFCSTTDVYTKQAKNFPLKENAERKPSASFPYAYNKAACENILMKAHDKGDLPVTIIRPNATYCDFKMPVVHSFRGGTYHLDRILKGKPIISHGDGQSLWAECHSDDAGRAFVAATGNKNTLGKAYNLSGDEHMPWDTFWRTVAEVMKAPEPVFVHIPTDILVRIAPDLASWCYEHFQYNNFCDNTASKKDLGFKYTITWKEGFTRYFNWLQANGEIDNSDNYPFYDKIIEAWWRQMAALEESLKDIRDFGYPKTH